MDAKIAEIRGRKPTEDFISVLTEPADKIPVTYRFHRGDPKQPKEAVLPGGLSVLAPPGQTVELTARNSDLPTSGRRLAFARWLTSGTNPLVARVLVNRIWLHHFGRGLVGTPSDFGVMGERPTHPELLDWLASDFVEHGWRLKRLHNHHDLDRLPPILGSRSRGGDSAIREPLVLARRFNVSMPKSSATPSWPRAVP
jgi:hypothetical protein